MFTEARGKPNTVCFKNMTGFIVYDKCLPKEKKTQMTERIIIKQKGYNIKNILSVLMSEMVTC